MNLTSEKENTYSLDLVWGNLKNNSSDPVREVKVISYTQSLDIGLGIQYFSQFTSGRMILHSH